MSSDKKEIQAFIFLHFKIKIKRKGFSLFQWRGEFLLLKGRIFYFSAVGGSRMVGKGGTSVGMSGIAVVIARTTVERVRMAKEVKKGIS